MTAGDHRLIVAVDDHDADGVTSVTCHGSWEHRNSVMDGDMYDRSGARLPWLQLLDEQPVSRLELSFSSGARAVIDAATAILRLAERRTFLERWSGPL